MATPPTPLLRGARAFPRRASTALRVRMARRGLGLGAGFESRLTWVLGSPRSGTTWLMQIVDQLHQVAVLDEPLIGNYLGGLVCDFRGINIEDVDENNFTLYRQQRGLDSHFLADAHQDVWAPILGRLIKARFLAHMVRSSPPHIDPFRALLVVKEPNGSQAADLLLRATPQSRVVFMLRDGRDVVDSELAAQLKGAWATREFRGVAPVETGTRLEFVVRSAHKWLWRTSVVQQALQGHRGPSYVLRYEHLRRDTRQTLASFCEWLGRPLAPADLERLVDATSFENIPSERRGPSEFFRSATPGSWRDNLSTEEQAAMHKVLAPKLAELGYDV